MVERRKLSIKMNKFYSREEKAMKNCSTREVKEIYVRFRRFTIAGIERRTLGAGSRVKLLLERGL
jgi:hypothetical protein